MTTELDGRVEGSDGARNSIAQNSINYHRTRNQITHKLRGWERINSYTEKMGNQTNKQTDRPTGSTSRI